MNITTINDCPRCGIERHENIVVKTMMQPFIEVDGTIWDRWALCPISQDPILLRHEIEGKEVDKVTLIALRQNWLWAKYENYNGHIPETVDLNNPSARQDIAFLVELVSKILKKGMIK